MNKAVRFLLVFLALAAGQAAQAVGDDRIPFPKPASHRANWLEYHGKAAGAEGNSPGRPGKKCLVCHDRDDCIGCHTTIMPRDHHNAWRMRGHGLAAGGNSGRCVTCHKQDYCVRCHSETAPRTHTATWRKRHCTWCHFGSGDSIAGKCTVCHKRAQHVSAPHPVNPALNCELCHK
jgi:hypothetical protein